MPFTKWDAPTSTSCRLNSHHAAEGTSCVAGAVRNTRHITPLKSHHEHCFLQSFIAGANQSRKSVIDSGWNQGNTACVQSTCTVPFEITYENQQNIARAES